MSYVRFSWKRTLCAFLGPIIVLILALGFYKLIPIAPRPSEGVLFFYKNSVNADRQALLNINSLKLNQDQTFYIVIHGFTESSFRPWIQQLSSDLLHADPLSTILLVDHWNLLDFSRPRMKNNVLIIAQQVADTIKSLRKYSNLKLKNVHIIGFSLGGLISGVIPNYLDGKVKRITGIDPSYPWNATGDPKEYLDSEDAELVVTIRTSSVGLETPPVHFDFYINGGEVQPECSTWWHPFFIKQICSHYKAPILFRAALHEKTGTSCLCQERILPRLDSCSCSQTNSFGLNTDERLKGTFYMKT